MKITIKSHHGDFSLINNDPNSRIIEVLNRYNLPMGLFNIYSRKGNKLGHNISFYDNIEKLSSLNISEIVLKPIRNIDLEFLVDKKLVTEDKNDFVCEYTFPNEQDKNVLEIHKYSVDDCRNYVNETVAAFIKTHNISKDKPIIFGISGGGDSNTLIRAFLSSGLIDKEQIIAVMCLGVSTWDDGKERALQICSEYGVKLEFVSEKEIATFLGKDQNSDWVTGFNEVFPDSEVVEVLGTLAIRLSLTKYREKYDAQYIVTGLNLEDILAEGFFATMQGKLPLPFPFRTIDNSTFCYPLYSVPKKILDGCYPKFSLENYEQRTNDKLSGRAIAYFMAQHCNTTLPGSEFDLLNGFQSLSTTNKDYARYYEELGFSAFNDELPQELLAKWKYFTIV